MTRARHRASALLGALVAALPAGPLGAQQPPQPSLTLDAPASGRSADGNLRLTWIVAGDPDAPEVAALVFEIEEQTAAGHREVIAAGAHRAAALSGRDDGSYRFRVRAVTPTGAAGPWSEPIELEVEHHPLWLALTVFGVGAAVFLATAAVVITGRRRAGPASDDGGSSR